MTVSLYYGITQNLLRILNNITGKRLRRSISHTRLKVFRSIAFIILRRVMEKSKRPKERKNKLQEAFGKTLRERRLANELSQEGLAELANLHFTYVSSVERGERNISLENMAKLAKALKCHIKDLVSNIDLTGTN